MLKVYKASAGSGKTFTLASQYLVLALRDPYKFKSILAITFTNKAAEEMKTRILQALSSLASKGEKSEFYPVVKSELEYSGEAAAQRAKEVKKAILHDYSMFAVSTIDSFVQRVVRSFAYELRLPGTFQIELNQSKVLAELVEMLMESMDTNPQLAQWLKQFMLDRLSEGKSWDFKGQIYSIGQNIFSEDFLEKSSNVNLDRQVLGSLNQYLDTVIESYESKVNEIAAQAREFFDKVQCSGRNCNTVVKFLTEKILQGGSVDSTKTIQAIANGVDIDLKGTSTGEKELIYDFVARYARIYEDEYVEYKTAKLVKNNIYVVGIFSDLLKMLDNYKDLTGTWLINEMNLLLHQLVKDSDDAPVVYEKLGQYLENLMIDEFQDTSRFQWSNFRPLVAHSVSLGEQSLIVGDVKQSIYRWRNGDWNLLLYGVKNDFPGLEERTLETNWRSFKNIIDFNNSLFEVLPGIIQEHVNGLLDNASQQGIDIPGHWQSMIIEAYKDAKQQVSPKFSKGGSVETYFYRAARSKKEKEQYLRDDFIEAILGNLNEGYALSDIAVLVRTKEQAKIIAQWLVEYNATVDKEHQIRFLSDDSLYLSYPPAVMLIITLLEFLKFKILKMLDTQEEKSVLQKIVYFYKQSVEQESISLNKIFETENIWSLLPSGTDVFISSLQNKTLFEIVESIIEHFSLNALTEQIPYIRTFENLVLDFVYTEGSDLDKFLTWWQTTGSGETVTLSSTIDAVRLMTIHASKGLAFPVVMMPFVDWSHKPKSNSFILASSKHEPYNILGTFPVEYSSKLADTFFAADYYRETLFAAMDNLNILYVAFTRPVAKLQIFAFTKYLVKKTTEAPVSIGDFLYLAMSHTYEVGEPSEGRLFFALNNDYKVYRAKKEQINSFGIENYTTNDWRNRVSVATKASEELLTASGIREYGTLMHNILAEVVYASDLEKVIEKYLKEGILNIDTVDQIRKDLNSLINLPGVRDWFSDKWQVYNERTIITDYGEEKRPDRVLENRNEIIVIDFKFGKEHEEYYDQVREYMHKLQEQEPDKRVRGYLLYANKHLVKEVTMDGFQPKLF